MVRLRDRVRRPIIPIVRYKSNFVILSKGPLIYKNKLVYRTVSVYACMCVIVLITANSALAKNHIIVRHTHELTSVCLFGRSLIHTNPQIDLVL